MSVLAALIAALLAGMLGALGLGGGGVLIIYLSIFASYDQLKSQGINLLFFIPLAIIALIIHAKNHLIKWKSILPMCISGLVGAAVGSFIAGFIDPNWLTKIFASGILILGIKELFAKSKSTDKSEKINIKKSS